MGTRGAILLMALCAASARAQTPQDIERAEEQNQQLLQHRQGRASGARAFRALVGEILTRRDLERGSDQINRLGSNSARVDIEPGDEPGASRVLINDEARKRWLASASADNSGAAATGRNV